MTEKDLEIQQLRRDLISAENRCRVYKNTVYTVAKENEKLKGLLETARAQNDSLISSLRETLDEIEKIKAGE